MSRVVGIGLWALVACSALAGCAHHKCCPQGSARQTQATAAETMTTLVERGQIAPDLTILSTPEALQQGRQAKPTPTKYRQLHAEQCQCLAAANCALANLLEEESKLGTSSAKGQRSASKPDAVMRRKMLAYRAVDERNHSAASALRTFYLLAEAESARDRLKESRGETKRMIEHLKSLKDQGLQVDLDDRLLERQRLDLLDQKRQSQLLVSQLNGQLRALVGLDADDETLIWPAADLTVTAGPVDEQAAVREGMAHRADIGMLRMMNDSLEVGTLPAARSELQQADPMLGSSKRAGHLLGGANSSKHSAELQTRRTQLQQQLDDRTRTATEEIRQKARAVETRLQQIALAKQTRDVCADQLKRLEMKRDADGVTPFDISKARLELIRAESEQVHKVIAWKIAQVELKEAQGLLAAECGYNLPRGGCGR